MDLQHQVRFFSRQFTQMNVSSDSSNSQLYERCMSLVHAAHDDVMIWPYHINQPLLCRQIRATSTVTTAMALVGHVITTVTSSRVGSSVRAARATCCTRTGDHAEVNESSHVVVTRCAVVFTSKITYLMTSINILTH